MTNSGTRNESIRPLLHPKYWLVWLGMGVAFVLSHISWPTQQRLGAGLGIALYHLAHRRRRICMTNLEICFPDMMLEEKRTLARNHFISMGKGFFETLTCWFQDRKKLLPQTKLTGDHLIREALSQGRGCVLIGGHFSSIDICGSLLAHFLPVHPLYKLQSNPVINWFMERKRDELYKKTIERSNMREVIKSLKTNNIVWYAVDQDYGRKYSVFAPFFGRQCATLAHVGRVIKLSKAPVVAIDYYRTESGYQLDMRMVHEFPAEDDIAAATLMNQLMEENIMRHPEQYFWSHRRFKTQPDPSAPSPY